MFLGRVQPESYVHKDDLTVLSSKITVTISDQEFPVSLYLTSSHGVVSFKAGYNQNGTYNYMRLKLAMIPNK